MRTQAVVNTVEEFIWVSNFQFELNAPQRTLLQQTRIKDFLMIQVEFYSFPFCVSISWDCLKNPDLHGIKLCPDFLNLYRINLRIILVSNPI